MGRQCVKEDPPGRWDSVSVFCVTLLSQDQPLVDRGACRLQASGDSTGGRAWSRMTTTSVRARRVGRPSSRAEWCTVSVQDTICQDTFHDACFCLTRHNLFKTHFTMLDEPELPEHEVQEPEDAHKKGKPCLILTRSVQDTIYSRHISRCLFLSQRHNLFKTHFTMLVSVSNPMSTSPVPVIEYVASVSAITYTALSPVTEYVAPAPVVTYAAASWEIDYVASAPVVFHAAPVTVTERSSLYKSEMSTNSTSRLKEEKKRSHDAMHLFIFLFCFI